MAGDWIKMRSNLWDHPKVARVCDLTGQNEATVIGAMYWLWAMADQHTEDGAISHLLPGQIDRKTDVKGFAAAMVAIGWLALIGGEDQGVGSQGGAGVLIPEFHEHNGSSAKKRSQTARRVASHRSGGTGDGVDFAGDLQGETHTVDACNAGGVTGALAREEKRREDKRGGAKAPPVASESLPTAPGGGQSGALPTSSTPMKVLAAARQPPCELQAVVAVFHELLPELPSCRVMTADRERCIRKRWQWVVGSRRPDGSARASSGAEALGWFRRFFELTRENDFVMGRTPRGAGHEGWKPDLDYLLSDKGLRQVIEKTEVAA